MLGISKQTKHNENNNKLTHKAKQTQKHQVFCNFSICRYLMLYAYQVAQTSQSLSPLQGLTVSLFLISSLLFFFFLVGFRFQVQILLIHKRVQHQILFCTPFCQHNTKKHHQYLSQIQITHSFFYRKQYTRERESYSCIIFW